MERANARLLRSSTVMIKFFRGECMNILLLGNGFDLHHKLPTKYDNFLNTMNAFQNHFKTNKPKNLGEVFGKILLDENVVESYKEYESIYDNLTISEEEYNSIMELEGNYWYRYFNKSFNKDVGWIDFEKEINRVINDFKDWFDNFKNTSGNNNRLECYIDERFKYNYTVIHFDFLFKNKNVHMSNFTVIDDAYSKREPEKYGLIVLNKEKIVEKLYNELMVLSNALKLYLQLFVNNVLKHSKFKNICKKESVFSEFDEIISFNYTSTYEILYQTKKTNFIGNNGYNQNVHHIHGKLSDNIVLGVNSNTQDKLEAINTLFLRFKKYFQRVVLKTDLSYIEFTEKYKKSSKNICTSSNSTENKFYLEIYGHSLDKTDEDVIKYLFDLADEIIVYYYSEEKLPDLVSNLVNIYAKNDFDKIRLEKHLTFQMIGD